MITVDVIFDDNHNKRGFVVSGHAEYAENGYDIVCAGVSALTFTCINSMDELLGIDMNVSVDEESGLISCIFNNVMSEKALLLFESMLIGLRDIEENYGNRYLIVNDQEVSK